MFFEVSACAGRGRQMGQMSRMRPPTVRCKPAHRLNCIAVTILCLHHGSQGAKQTARQ